MLDSIKKMFARSNIKDAAPAPAETRKLAYPASSVAFRGSRPSCDAIQSYFMDFIHRRGQRLFIGELNKTHPNCALYIEGYDFGQVYSIGLTYGETDNITIKTATGSFAIDRGA